jgi:hypothetical protein
MTDLVGGDWNDDYWGESGGFIYGCQGDFGFNELPTSSFTQLARSNTTKGESGVFVLDQFQGSGKSWEFKILNVRQICQVSNFSLTCGTIMRPSDAAIGFQVCQENFCGDIDSGDSAAARSHAATWGVLGASAVFTVATSLFLLRGTSSELGDQ